MREIIFRGKRIDNGEWVHGNYCEQPMFGRKPIPSIQTTTEEQNGLICEYEMCVEEVDPTTIGQYTGITDKNGTKIFEGDVVDYFCHSTAEIKYRNGAYMIWTEEMFDLLINPQGGIEVIGNIHDKEGK